MSPECWDAVDENYGDAEHLIHTDIWCAGWQALALENYDLNMAYFAFLDHAEFDQPLAQVVGAWRLVKVAD
ncbi:hypothetical protein, partial [Georgenia sp. MJ170]|uniref:hypothetical protein n=1 Tax=Georgenia sunbinii TaxID=3117728 RepID=UPI002F26CE82